MSNQKTRPGQYGLRSGEKTHISQFMLPESPNHSPISKGQEVDYPHVDPPAMSISGQIVQVEDFEKRQYSFDDYTLDSSPFRRRYHTALLAQCNHTWSQIAKILDSYDKRETIGDK